MSLKKLWFIAGDENIFPIRDTNSNTQLNLTKSNLSNVIGVGTFWVKDKVINTMLQFLNNLCLKYDGGLPRYTEFTSFDSNLFFRPFRQYKECNSFVYPYPSTDL